MHHCLFIEFGFHHLTLSDGFMGLCLVTRRHLVQEVKGDVSRHLLSQTLVPIHHHLGPQLYGIRMPGVWARTHRSLRVLVKLVRPFAYGFVHLRVAGPAERGSQHHVVFVHGAGRCHDVLTAIVEELHLVHLLRLGVVTGVRRLDLLELVLI